jgi:hypothetical protein
MNPFQTLGQGFLQENPLAQALAAYKSQQAPTTPMPPQ